LLLGQINGFETRIDKAVEAIVADLAKQAK
jgi:hypothetical protein